MQKTEISGCAECFDCDYNFYQLSTNNTEDILKFSDPDARKFVFRSAGKRRRVKIKM
ncbi:MAG: hypothetical protein LBK06_06330 [Planctomycetaceae bacterium]|nr:hypothetical protein [Planctomycetaceae bacterium]